MLPEGTNYNVRTPNLDDTLFDSPGLTLSIVGLIGQGGGDENVPHTESGDTGGDDEHLPDDGNEGQ